MLFKFIIRSEIIDYYYHHVPFTVDMNRTNNKNYRMITQKECDTIEFKKLFMSCYNNDKGLYSLDDFIISLDYMLVHNMTHFLLNKKNAIFLKSSKIGNIKKDIFATFGGVESDCIQSIDSIQFMTNQYSYNQALLFIKKGIKLY